MIDLLFSLTSFLNILTSLIPFQVILAPLVLMKIAKEILPQNPCTSSFLYLEYLVPKHSHNYFSCVPLAFFFMCHPSIKATPLLLYFSIFLQHIHHLLTHYMIYLFSSFASCLLPTSPLHTHQYTQTKQK